MTENFILLFIAIAITFLAVQAYNNNRTTRLTIERLIRQQGSRRLYVEDGFVKSIDSKQKRSVITFLTYVRNIVSKCDSNTPGFVTDRQRANVLIAHYRVNSKAPADFVRFWEDIAPYLANPDNDEVGSISHLINLYNYEPCPQ